MRPAGPAFETHGVIRVILQEILSILNGKVCSCRWICGVVARALSLYDLGGVPVRASDLRSSSSGFDSRSGRYQAT